MRKSVWEKDWEKEQKAAAMRISEDTSAKILNLPPLAWRGEGNQVDFIGMPSSPD